MTTYQPPRFPRLEPRTPWQGGRIADTDVLTLDDAARFANVHSGAEITPADFLRAAGRGEILLRAICPRAVTMQPCRESDAPLPMPENFIPTLPLDACISLANTGRATWRTIDWFEPADSFAGEICRFTRWQLADGEPDLVTMPDDCRVIGRDVHALADTYIEAPAQDTATLAPVVPAGAPETPEQRRARWLELFEAEQKRQKRGALQRLADSLGTDHSNLGKDLNKARAARAEQKRAGSWTSQLVQDGKRLG